MSKKLYYYLDLDEKAYYEKLLWTIYYMDFYSTYYSEKEGSE